MDLAETPRRKVLIIEWKLQPAEFSQRNCAANECKFKFPLAGFAVYWNFDSATRSFCFKLLSFQVNVIPRQMGAMTFARI